MRFGLLFTSMFYLAACGDDAASTDLTTPDSSVEPAPIDASTPQPDSAVVPLGDPIEAPDQTWTWVPFEDARCANDTATGIGVNLSSASSRVFIYLQGGGACWNNLTCYILNAAVNLDGYGEADFQSDATGILTTSIFDRTDPQNPIRDWSFVFVPYCTGDIHSGSNTANHGGRPTMHVGYDNMTAYLERIVPTFPDAERVVLSGSSAGGYGAAGNWHRVQELFGATRVDLLNDSGPPIPQAFVEQSQAQEQRASWGLDNTLPADCAGCADDLYALVDYGFSKYPDSRKALLSYTQDNVISLFNQLSGAELEQALNEVSTQTFAQYPTAHTYYVPGNEHVLLRDPNNVSQSGVVLMDWITQMITDDPSWTSVTP